MQLLLSSYQYIYMIRKCRFVQCVKNRFHTFMKDKLCRKMLLGLYFICHLLLYIKILDIFLFFYPFKIRRTYILYLFDISNSCILTCLFYCLHVIQKISSKLKILFIHAIYSSDIKKPRNFVVFHYKEFLNKRMTFLGYFVGKCRKK